MGVDQNQVIDVFISHSSQDTAIAEQIVGLLRAALNIRAGMIRCTSVDGYRLPLGVNSDEQLRKEVLDAKVFVAILSIDSLASTYVLFELGARWGVGKYFAPLLAAGLSAHALRGPLSGLNALSCESGSQLHQFIHDLARVLDITPEEPQAYQAKIDALIYAGTNTPPQSIPVQRDPRPSSVKSGTPRKEPELLQRGAEDAYSDADTIIRHHCEQEWPDDFNMRAYCIDEQRKAVDNLKQGRPTHVPDEVFRSIRLKCATEWPDDYSMRAYCELQQIEGYEKVTG